MEKIVDYTVYNNAMRATLSDKLWFLDYINSDIDTVVDFGCADGSLMIEIEKNFPNKFHYIGIDNDDIMLGNALNNTKVFSDRVTFAKSLDGVSSIIKLNNCILVLNSVIHELCSYLSYVDRHNLFHQFATLGFKYIAIRDMHLVKEDPLTIQMRNFNWHEDNDLYSSWIAKNYYSAHDINREVEFLLKYRYRRNWTRESAERYLWDWETMFTNYFSKRQIKINFDFYIPFIFNSLNEKYHTNIVPFNTHKKMLIQID